MIENDQFMSLAWHIEAFSRSGKKLPSLDKVLGRKKDVIPARQSNEDILSAMRVWAASTKEAAETP